MEAEKLTKALNGETWSKLKPAQKFEIAWKAWGYSQAPSTEHMFDADRKWRFDYCWPALRIAVEINGFGYGHQSVGGVIEDAEKVRAATLAGWKVFVFTSACVGSKARAYEAIEQLCMLMSDASD